MSAIRIQDTLTGQTRELHPNDRGEVGIYACGPTVYGRIHIGNARPYVVFTLLKRFLEHQGLAAKLVINVTDINDKIYDAAREAGEPSDAYAEEMTAAYVADTDALGLERPDAEPLASGTIEEIVSLIQSLIDSDHAYQANGDVYFRVRSFGGYGKLSNRDPEDMDQGEEAGTAALKEDPLDFALWKGHKEGEDTSWDSPWGKGRPGWHIECSAMSEKELGTDFAIHGGGIDLVFPHHENEIAQTEAGRGVPLAEIWMHNGLVLAGPEDKMAKSEGNVFLLHEALEKFGPEAVIGFLISGHYRQPLSFSRGALEEAVARNERVREFFRSAERIDGEPAPQVTAARRAFIDALADDFNTPRATAEIFDLVTEGNKQPLSGAHSVMEEMLQIVGLESLSVAEETPDEHAKALLASREEARKSKDYSLADELRNELARLGWDVRDEAGGARLVRRR